MKAKMLLPLLAVFSFTFTANIHANQRETVTFSNVDKHENGCTKEFLYCDKSTNAPLTKTVYQYDTENRLQEKATYEWNDTKGWTGVQKYIYSYDENNQPATLVLLKWNKKSNDWEK